MGCALKYPIPTAGVNGNYGSMQIRDIEELRGGVGLDPGHRCRLRGVKDILHHVLWSRVSKLGKVKSYRTGLHNVNRR